MGEQANDEVLVRNIGTVNEFIGIQVIPPGGLGMLPRLTAQAIPTLSLVSPPAAQAAGLFVFRAKCGYSCYHSLCTLTAALVERLRARGMPVEWSAFRQGFDQPILQARERTWFCNAGTFEWQGKRIAWPFFDNDRIGRVHLAYLRQHFDYAFASSRATEEGLLKAGYEADRILYVPLAVDTETFSPEGEVADLHPGKFLFFLAGALSERKGTDIALAAYAKAFRKSDPVVLLLKNYNYGRHAETEVLVAKHRADGDAPEVDYVYTLKDHWMPEHLASVFRRIAQRGAYVAPSRVEGFGLTPLEAACCAAPVGLTKWAGHTDFLEPPMVGFPYQPSPSRWNLQLYQPDETPEWAEVDVEAVSKWMQAVCKKAPPMKKRIELAGRLREKWSYAKYAERFEAALHSTEAGYVAVTLPTAKVAPIVGEETLGIGIPTLNRPGESAKLLALLLTQTKLPQRLVIVDDGGGLSQEATVQGLLEQLRILGVDAAIIGGPRKGQPWSHQMAMEHLGTDLVLRIDDDIQPAGLDFVERLWRQISGRPEVGAVAGVYPRIGDGAIQNWAQVAGAPGMTNRLGDMLAGQAGLQFHRYDQEILLEVEHLYCTWIYRRAYLEAVGGFPTCYSRMCFREETDASARLKLLGGYKLLVDTGAVAWHNMIPAGGMRENQSTALKDNDDRVFRQRLTQWQTQAAGAA